MADAALSTEFVGRRGRLFWLALRTSVLTLLTLGFYRFWMKTRLRRFYWSSIRPGNTPLEYVGEPLEKLLGFLVAVVFLAFYIGVVNLVLMFASFAVFHGNVFAYALSFIGVIPIIFYARYRARRYVLARSRWRGIRFGMEPGAWGYAWRALVHWLITIGSLGLLWPRMTFWLEKYRTDRTYFGTARMEQGGRWAMLYRAAWPLILAAPLAVLAGLAAAGDPALVPAAVVAGLAVAYGLVHYRVVSFRLLAGHKSVGDVRLKARPRIWRVALIYALGYGLTALILAAFLLLVAVGAVLVLGPALDTLSFDVVALSQVLPLWLTAALGVAAYFAFFIAWGVFRHVFVTLPLLRHYARTLTLEGTEALPAVAQRERDGFVEAEGFAEALDVGAAI